MNNLLAEKEVRPLLRAYTDGANPYECIHRAWEAGFQYRDAEVKLLKYALLEILHYSQDADERREIARRALEGGETHSVRIKESGEVTIPYGHTLKDNGDGTFTVEPIKNLDGVNKDGV